MLNASTAAQKPGKFQKSSCRNGDTHLYARKPMPSSRQSGTISFSQPRVNRLHSLTPCEGEMVQEFAGHRRRPKLGSIHESE